MDPGLLLLAPTDHTDHTGRFHADPACPLLDTIAQHPDPQPQPTWCVCVPATPAPQSAALVALDREVQTLTALPAHPAGSLSLALHPEVGVNGMLNALDGINRALTDPATAATARALGDRLTGHARRYYSDPELYHRLGLGFIKHGLSRRYSDRAPEFGPFTSWWQVTEASLTRRAAHEGDSVERAALDGLSSALTDHPHDMHLALTDPERAYQLCGGAIRLPQRSVELLQTLADLISTAHVAAAQFADIASRLDATGPRQLAIGNASRAFNYVDAVTGLLIVRSYVTDPRVIDAMVSAATPRRGHPQLWLLPSTLAVALDVYDASVEALGAIRPEDTATTFALAVELSLDRDQGRQSPLETARHLTR